MRLWSIDGGSVWWFFRRGMEDGSFQEQFYVKID